MQLVGIRQQPRRGTPQTHAASGQSSTHSATANPAHPDVGNECHTPYESDDGSDISGIEPHCKLPEYHPPSVSDDSSESFGSESSYDSATNTTGDGHGSTRFELSQRDRDFFMQFCDRDKKNDPVLDCHGRVVDDDDTNNPNRPADELQTRWSDVWHAPETGTDMDIVRIADEQTAKLARYMEKCVNEKERYEEEVRCLYVVRDQSQDKLRRNMLRVMMNEFIASIGGMAVAWNNQACFTAKYQELHSSLIRLRKCRILPNEVSMLCNTWVAYPDKPPVDHDETPSKKRKNLWNAGRMTTKSGNHQRILLPLRYVADCIRAADIDVYTQTGYIRVDLDRVDETTRKKEEIRWLRTDMPGSHSKTSLTKMFGGPTSAWLKWENKIPNHIEFGTIEFSWNYDKYMSRFHLQTPTDGDATRHRMFLDDVLQTLRLTKQCQFMREIRLPTDFPLNDLDDMPVVVWMKRAVNRAVPRWPAHGGAMDRAADSADHGWSTGYTNRDWPTCSADHDWDQWQQRGDAQWHQRGDAQWQTGDAQ